MTPACGRCAAETRRANAAKAAASTPTARSDAARKAAETRRRNAEAAKLAELESAYAMTA